MDNWLIALLLKPFVALAFFTATLLIARAIYPHIPDGWIKQLLYDPTLRVRYPWRFAIGAIAGAWGLAGLLALLLAQF